MKKFTSEPNFASPSFSVQEWLNAWQRSPELAKQTRWSTFRPEDVSVSDWQKIIGYDANNLRHMELQHSIVRDMRYWLHDAGLHLSPTESTMLSAVAVHHDLGEVEVGDKQGQWKTQADTTEEHNVLGKILEEEHPFSLISAELRAEILQTLDDASMQYPATIVAQIFKVSEYIGYTRTMLRMWRKIQRNTYDEILSAHLKFLVQNVAVSTGSRLIEIQESKHYDERIQACITDYIHTFSNDIRGIIKYCADTENHNNWLAFEREVFTKQGLSEDVIVQRLDECRKRSQIVCKRIPVFLS